MKVKDLIIKLKQLDNQEAEIFYSDEDDYNFKLIIIENQEQFSKGNIRTYYTIEKE